jgi:hypothetical protein
VTCRLPKNANHPPAAELADKAADHRWKAAEALIHCDIPRHLKHTRVARWGVRHSWSPVPDQRWRLDAACAGVDREVFLPERGESLEAPRAYCRRCPVQYECLEAALALGQQA